ncbi:MAG TPA: hypothetical protein VMS60_15845 [Solirubrobacterales bacterium]|nr:hypothetical protein [Solirubrobacterales bacterium]
MAIDEGRPQDFEARVLDDALAPGEAVRCVLPALAEHLASDPLAWMPYTTPAGIFYPKHGDRALVTEPDGGPPAIVAWWPSATEPDHEFS